MHTAPEQHEAARPPEPRGPRHRGTIVFIITALGAFMASLDLSIVNIAFPDIKTSYPQASQASLAWIITAYSIVFGALLATRAGTSGAIPQRKEPTMNTAVPMRKVRLRP